MLTQYHFDLVTQGRGMINITGKVSEFVSQAAILTGLCHVFLHHTSASLVLCENADPLVQRDMEAFMFRLVPDGDPLFLHIDEGQDDMPSHVRSILTQNFLTVPITDGKLALGRWQGMYMWEHRLKSHHRKLTVTVYS